MSGLNLHVYPSTMLNESRILRFSEQIQSTGLFSATHLVGKWGPSLPRNERVDAGRTIVRIGLRGERSGAAWKVLSAFAWYGLVYWRYRGSNAAIVAAHSVWTLPTCWLIAWRTGASLVYNTHELETETPSMTGVKQAIARFIERQLIGRCALVSCANGSVAQWYARTYAIATPISVLNIPLPPEASVPLRPALGLASDELLFIHTGRITSGRHVQEILDVFSSPGATAHVVFLGDGPLRHLVTAAAAHTTNIHWLPPVPADTVVSYVAEADVALCLIDLTSLSYRMSSPNKLLEGLAAHVPVVCTELSEARRLMGSEFDKWLVKCPPKHLEAFVVSVTAADIARFKTAWPGLHTWKDEVQALSSAYARLVARTH